MIYITGDIHGDMERLSKTELSMLNKNDTLIVCGDFGFIWNNDIKESQFLNRLEKRKYNICFIDGTHENFNVLGDMSVAMWNGGRVHKVRSNVFHLMRGQIYEIENKKIFIMGGGEDPEYDLHDSDDQIIRTILEKNNYKVDYIITHEPPAKIRDFLRLSENKTLRVTALGAYFDELSQQCEFSKWFFGSMHTDKFISDKYVCLFRNIVTPDKTKTNEKLFSK